MMVHSSELFDGDLLARMEAEGFVRRRHHDTLPVSILNYTEKAQYGREWNPVTLNCRGLILDDDGHVVARPFPKFFNLHEHPDGHPDMRGPFEVAEKLDGSLGIMWHWDDEVHVATRGTFDSDQAKWATEWMRERWPEYSAPGMTALVEIIYPTNRIVLDYGDRAECVFLALLDHRTGRNVNESITSLTRAKTYAPGDLSPADVIRLDPEGEGFVITFTETGFRVKVKHEEYVRLHRLLTSTSTKTVWEALRAGKPVEDMAEHVPDEFHEWLRATAAQLTAEHAEIMLDARAAFAEIEHLRDDRKAFAAEAVKSEHRGLLFSLLDGKDASDAVWKSLRPEHARPYVSEV